MLEETSCKQSSQVVQPTRSRTSTFEKYDNDEGEEEEEEEKEEKKKEEEKE